MGIDTRIHVNDGDVTFERVQDCTPILEDATERHNAGLHGSGDMKHAARIPMVIIERYLNDHGITLHEFMVNKEHVRRMLNDPTLAGFRIWKGAI